MKNKNNTKSKKHNSNPKRHKLKTRENNTSIKKYKYLYTFLFVLIFIIGSFIFKSKIPFMNNMSLQLFSEENYAIDSRYRLEENTDPFIKKILLLEGEIFTNHKIQSLELNPSYETNGEPLYVAYLSISDSKSRAKVIQGVGPALDIAWNKAVNNVIDFIEDNDYKPIWVKADIVDSVNKIKTSNLNEILKPYYEHFYKKGISLDKSFDLALIESEINGNKIINFDDDKIDLKRLNEYLKDYRGFEIGSIPNYLYEFTTIGYFCDESDIVYELYTDELNYGRRKIESVDKELVKEIITNSTQFLMDNIQDSGKFVYGYFPTYDKEIDNYNILRHTGTIWSLVIQYKITGDKNILPKVDSAIKYLIEDAVVYKDDNTAYIVERKANEIKLGGNAVAIIMLTSYMDEFKTDIYKDLVIKLGNGILEMQDQVTGKYYHVLNYPDYSKKEEYRTVYYDGEATFALGKLYGLTKDAKWLEGARIAVDYFIENDYTQYRDHWVAYSVNEITKYLPEEKYFKFGLKNAQVNLERIYNQKTSYHTYLELLMVTFELYERIIANDIQVEYLKEFDEDKLVETINHRASHMLNGYFYPEYAMYFKNPERILNSFFVRHDAFRIRIDDVQHFIGGYYNYYKYYEDLMKYR